MLIILAVTKEEELDDDKDDELESEKDEEQGENQDDSQNSGPQSFFDAESEDGDGDETSIFDVEETVDAAIEPQADNVEENGSLSDNFEDATTNLQSIVTSEEPELNSWFLEDSDDDDDDSVVPEIDRCISETASTRECPDLEEDVTESGEEDEEEYDDDDDVSIIDATIEGVERYTMAPNDGVFVVGSLYIASCYCISPLLN